MKELLEMQYSIYNGELFSYRETPAIKITFEDEREFRDFVLVEEILVQRQNPECKVVVRPVTMGDIRMAPPIEKKEPEPEIDVNLMPQWRKPKFMKDKII